MRSLALLTILATATPALACPRSARCVVDEARPGEAPRAKRAISLRLARAPERAPWRYDLPDPPDDVPWIWRVLRREAKRNVPTYRDGSVSVSPAPVVVVSPAFDTELAFGITVEF